MAKEVLWKNRSVTIFVFRVIFLQGEWTQRPLKDIVSYLDWSEHWYFVKNKYIEKSLWYVNRVYDDEAEKRCRVQSGDYEFL